ncbi:LCP family protein [Streptomyces sp. NPDC048603]|uniref:LCP family protein n=1 Tax=Streptomyces sp. NPDC048603 TaxID=3365577 RepID=UPI0037155827
MNDPQEPQFIGYDEYGRPVYRQVPAAPPRQYGQYPQQYQQQPYGHSGHDAYGQPVARPQAPQQYQQQPQAAQQYYGRDGYDGYDGYDTGQMPQMRQMSPQMPQQAGGQWIPQQAPAPDPDFDPDFDPESEFDEGPGAASGGAQVPGPRSAPDYRTEQFAFLDQPDEDTDDVIDWLKFTESRTERREEARRRGRNRVIALMVVLALFVAGGVGYLWYADKLPFLGRDGSGKGAAADTGPQKRDMVVVHLHNTKRGGTSTALLVDNVTAKKGATVLLPNTMTVPRDDGTSVALGKSVEEDGLGGTREALDAMLGTHIGGTWRLDTPYLENLVQAVGGIEVDTDTAVPADDKAKTPAVGQGQKQSLTGAMAVAYATHRAQGEPEAKQLERFGKVMYATLRKMPSDEHSAVLTVESLGQILDPSLTDRALGGSLARLAEHAKLGAYRTDVVAVKPDGTMADEAGRTVVKEILGGSLTAPPGASAAPRVGLKDATGSEKALTAARAALVNGGYTFVDGGKAGQSQAGTQVTYQDDAQREKAVEVAKTLGLPETAVKKAASTVNADVVVVLGKDYKTP